MTQTRRSQIITLYFVGADKIQQLISMGFNVDATRQTIEITSDEEMFLFQCALGLKACDQKELVSAYEFDSGDISDQDFIINWFDPITPQQNAKLENLGAEYISGVGIKINDALKYEQVIQLLDTFQYGEPLTSLKIAPISDPTIKTILSNTGVEIEDSFMGTVAFTPVSLVPLVESLTSVDRKKTAQPETRYVFAVSGKFDITEVTHWCMLNNATESNPTPDSFLLGVKSMAKANDFTDAFNDVDVQFFYFEPV